MRDQFAEAPSKTAGPENSTGPGLSSDLMSSDGGEVYRCDDLALHLLLTAPLGEDRGGVWAERGLSNLLASWVIGVGVASIVTWVVVSLMVVCVVSIISAVGNVPPATLHVWSAWLASLTAAALGLTAVYSFVSGRYHCPVPRRESRYAALLLSLMPYLSAEASATLRCAWWRGVFRVTLCDGREAVLTLPLPEEGARMRLRVVIGQPGAGGPEGEFDVRDVDEAALRLVDFLEHHLPQRVSAPGGAPEFELVATPQEPPPTSPEGSIGARLALPEQLQRWLRRTLDDWPARRRWKAVMFLFGLWVPVALVLVVGVALDPSGVDVIHFLLRAVPFVVFPGLFEVEHGLDSSLPKDLKPQWPALEVLRVRGDAVEHLPTGQSLALGGAWGVRLYRDPVRVDVLGVQIVSKEQPDGRWSFRVPCRVPDEVSLETLDVRGPMLNAGGVVGVLWPTLSLHLALRGETLPWSWARRHGA